MEAYIEVDCSVYSKNMIEVLRVFQKIGWWIYNPQGRIEYLPVADNDNYDWQCEKISEMNFLNIIDQKITNGELLGINLFYDNSNVGVSLLAYNTKHITLGISINRKIVYKSYTDMAWYLENIIYKLLKSEIRLLSYKFGEYED